MVEEVTYALKCQWCPRSFTMTDVAVLNRETWKAEDEVERQNLAKVMQEHYRVHHKDPPSVDEIKKWVKVLKPFDFPLQFTSEVVVAAQK